jgi:hypothetical protein
MDPLKPHTQKIIEAEIARASRENALEPKERVAMTDQKALLNLDIGRVLANEVEFYDPPRERPRR